MILTCPSCGTQYAVKEGAIPPQGRKVRCASCGTSWLQSAEQAALEPEDQQTADQSAAEPPRTPEPPPPAEPQVDEMPEDPTPGYSAVPPIAPGPTHVEPPMSVPLPPSEMAGWDISGRSEDEFDPEKDIPATEDIWAVEQETPVERRRTWRLAIVTGLLLVTALAAAFWLLAPDSLRRSVGLAAAPTPLQVTVEGSRQTLASGNELLAVSGRVINPSSETQPVPPIHAEIRDGAGKVLHSWVISQPVPTLAAGQKASFNSAQMDVPAGGDQLTVTLGAPPRG